MNKLYYLGNSEFIKLNDNFEFNYILEEDITSLTYLKDYQVQKEKIPHGTLMKSYLLTFEDKGLFMFNPIRTNKYYFFSCPDQETISNIINQKLDSDIVGYFSDFLIRFREINVLDTI